MARQPRTLDQFQSDLDSDNAEYEFHRQQVRIEQLLSDYGRQELVDAWAIGRTRDGRDLTEDEFGSLCENFLKVFGELPQEPCGFRADGPTPMSQREAERAQKDQELAAIPDDDYLDRKTTARLIGVSIESLDRYVLRGEAVGGVVLLALRPGQHTVRYRVRDVKAVRAGMLKQAREASEAKTAEQARYAIPGLPARSSADLTAPVRRRR